MTDLHNRLENLAGDAPAVLPESDLWLRGRRLRRSRRIGRTLTATGVVLLLVAAALGLTIARMSVPPVAGADSALGLPGRVAVPSEHLGVSDTPGPSAAVIGAARHKTRFGAETMPVAVSGVDGSSRFVRTPDARLDESGSPVGLSLSPDGRFLAYEVDASRPTLAVLDLINGNSRSFGFPDVTDAFSGREPAAVYDRISRVAWSTTAQGDRLVWARPSAADEFESELPLLFMGNLATGDVDQLRLNTQAFSELAQARDRFVVLDSSAGATRVRDVGDLVDFSPSRPSDRSPVDLNLFTPIVDPESTRIAVPGTGGNEDGSPVLIGSLGSGPLKLSRVENLRADRLVGWRGNAVVGEGLDGEAPLAPEVVQVVDLETGEVTDLVDIEVDPESVTWAATAWQGALIEVAEQNPLPTVVREGILIGLLIVAGFLIEAGIRRRRARV